MTSRLLKEDERYKIESRVGTGAMATVFKAYDLRLQRTVALKVLHEHLSSNAELRLRFEQEAKLAARIVHPNIVRTYDFGLNNNNQLFIVSEFIGGRSLTLAMRQYKNESQTALHPILAALVALEISKGVEAAHLHSVIHRDLKPDNVLVSQQGEIKLTDFGVARPFESSMTQVGQFIGSLTYASPEQIKGLPLDARSDIFSLGVMLFEILTGRLPFRSSNPTDLAVKISKAEVEPLSQLRPAIPQELDQIVRQCLRADPSERPQNASSIVSQLENYLKNEEVIPSNQAISDGFLNPELFTSTVRRSSILEVDKSSTLAQVAVTTPPVLEQNKLPIQSQIQSKSKSKYRSHDPKVRIPASKTLSGKSTEQRRYAALILTTTSVTLLAVTLIIKEREKISSFFRGAGDHQPHTHMETIENSELPPALKAAIENLKHLDSQKQIENLNAVEHDIQPQAPSPSPTAGAAAQGPKKQIAGTAKLKRNTAASLSGTRNDDRPTSSINLATQPSLKKPDKAKRRATPKRKPKTQTRRRAHTPNVSPTPTSINRTHSEGQIVVKTQPGEMTVYINGVFEGISSKQNNSRTFTIPAGNVTLKIPAQEQNGRMYKEFVGRFRIEPGKTVEIPIITLSPADGNMRGDP